MANTLTGEFPRELTLLKPRLRLLDIASNFFFTEGFNFNTVLGSLTKLTEIRMEITNSRNDGGIPTEISQLTDLGELNVASTLYRGALDGAAFPPTLSQLSILEIENNRFSSTIPSSIGNLPALQFFFARNCNLMGTHDALAGLTGARKLGATPVS